MKISYRLRFARKNRLRFLSHLEQIELIRRVVRRAGLPVDYSSGFHPQMKISFGPAISVGYESEAEYADIELTEKIQISEIAKKITEQLPEDFSLLGIKEIPDFFSSLESSLSLIKYRITNFPCQLSALGEQIDQFLNKKEILIEKHKNGRKKIIDLRPLVHKIEVKKCSGQACLTKEELELSLRFSPGHNVKPEKIVGVMFNLNEEQTKFLRITRLGLFSKNLTEL